MASLVPEAGGPPDLIPAVVSSYRFPPSEKRVNVRHCDGCRYYSLEFGNTLVEKVDSLKCDLVSEFELVVNSVLLGSGCTHCGCSAMIPLGSLPVIIPLDHILFPSCSLQLHRAPVHFVGNSLRMADKAPTLAPRVLLLARLLLPFLVFDVTVLILSPVRACPPLPPFGISPAQRGLFTEA